jgi:hypothetical protein
MWVGEGGSVYCSRKFVINQLLILDRSNVTIKNSKIKIQPCWSSNCYKKK